jgi:hypothetical protein
MRRFLKLDIWIACVVMLQISMAGTTLALLEAEYLGVCLTIVFFVSAVVRLVSVALYGRLTLKACILLGMCVSVVEAAIFSGLYFCEASIVLLVIVETATLPLEMSYRFAFQQYLIGEVPKNEAARFHKRQDASIATATIIGSGIAMLVLKVFGWGNGPIILSCILLRCVALVLDIQRYKEL